MAFPSSPASVMNAAATNPSSTSISVSNPNLILSNSSLNSLYLIHNKTLRSLRKRLQDDDGRYCSIHGGNNQKTTIYRIASTMAQKKMNDGNSDSKTYLNVSRRWLLRKTRGELEMRRR
ncbi:uncharacterized protein LOC131598732 isoform X2 [Vicia villosa]|uniref:uncharacterized protein LOC131598730 isoform X2 n=1 Tax=Vicia villosa TaxID=3911 RepID=UPI00273A897D|nr:uncharacterized protein LOC131598730 isoform X2 [Vicia villosa]XP_058727299.1 uncharacterized protein LOC131598732 isoform X2 [Vicia villosa]